MEVARAGDEVSAKYERNWLTRHRCKAGVTRASKYSVIAKLFENEIQSPTFVDGNVTTLMFCETYDLFPITCLTSFETFSSILLRYGREMRR